MGYAHGRLGDDRVRREPGVGSRACEAVHDLGYGRSKHRRGGLGDVAIALGMFALAGLVLRSADWPRSSPWPGGAIVVIGAMTFTTWSEWYNVYRTGSWAYASGMPTILGIGVSPVVQWLILPPVMVIAYRALAPRLIRARTPYAHS